MLGQTPVPQAVTVAGGWVFGITYILASFNQRLWHFALTQDVLLGIGASIVYVSTISVALTWFDQRRGLAMGIFISGSGVGGIHCQASTPYLSSYHSLWIFRQRIHLAFPCVSDRTVRRAVLDQRERGPCTSFGGWERRSGRR